MTTPVWLLDVDGVINVTRPGWGAPPRKGYALSMGVSWPVRWAPRLIDRIRALHAAGRVEIRWCSTWCPDADQLERLFGLPALGRTFTGVVPTGAEGDAAKLAAAQDVVREEGRSLVWTDDTAVPAAGPLHDELVSGGKVLLLAPPPRRGLQPADLDAIEGFLGVRHH
jgi:HAD domain in Swiss Army Knife RNA repair proteins